MNNDDNKNPEFPDTEDMHEENVEFEPVDEDGEASANAKVKDLRATIKKLEEEKREYLTGWQRAQADYINFKKEVELRRKDDIRFANKKLIESLLPTLDGYTMAKGNKEAWEKVDANWRTGIEYLFGNMLQVLEGEGLREFGVVGDTFSPELHESVEIVDSAEGKEDTLAEVLQKGYKIGDTVIRPARVKTFGKK